MQISVFNGSPKGDLSITLQYVHYIHKKFSQHESLGRFLGIMDYIDFAERYKQAYEIIEKYNNKSLNA